MHRFLHEDANEGEVCLRCLACGLAVDFPAEHEELARALLPGCEPNPGPAHHLVLIGHPQGPDHFYLECAYGDAAGDEPNLGPAPYAPLCVAA